jgi:hypothetical protein
LYFVVEFETTALPTRVRRPTLTPAEKEKLSMIRNHLHSALASAAVLLLSSGAVAQSAPNNAATAAAAQHVADKPATGDKIAADTKGNASDLAAKEADRALRLKTQHEAERQQLRGVLHSPMTDAQKQDLRLHAERVAKLERIRSLALDAKDTATADRATKLLEKESARYEKWLSSVSTKTDPTGNSQAKVGGQ